MAIVVEATAGVNSSRLAWQRDKGFRQGLAIHQRKFTTAWTVNDLGVGAGTVLLDHAVERVKTQANGVHGDGVAICVPSVGVTAVAENIAIGVIGRRDSGISK